MPIPPPPGFVWIKLGSRQFAVIVVVCLLGGFCARSKVPLFSFCRLWSNPGESRATPQAGVRLSLWGLRKPRANRRAPLLGAASNAWFVLFAILRLADSSSGFLVERIPGVGTRIALKSLSGSMPIRASRPNFSAGSPFCAAGASLATARSSSGPRGGLVAPCYCGCHFGVCILFVACTAHMY